MSEFQPGLVSHTVPRWSKVTEGGYDVLHIEGPGSDGGWAGIVRNKQGKNEGVSYDRNGKHVDGNEAFNLVLSNPKHQVVYCHVAVAASGEVAINSHAGVKFSLANLALIFNKDKLVGAKVL